MDDDQPTVPLPADQPQPARPADQPTVAPAPAGAPRPVDPEPFYKRHGLGFAISTLVLSVVLLLLLVGAGTFATVNFFTHVGERAISQMVPGAPGQRGGNDDDGGMPGGGMPGDGTSQGRVLVRGTIASMSSTSWTIDRQNGGSVTVAVDSSTAYGLPGRPEKASGFAEGDQVVVIGSRADGRITATRVLKVDETFQRPPTTPGPPATPGSPDL